MELGGRGNYEQKSIRIHPDLEVYRKNVYLKITSENSRPAIKLTLCCKCVVDLMNGNSAFLS